MTGPTIGGASVWKQHDWINIRGNRSRDGEHICIETISHGEHWHILLFFGYVVKILDFNFIFINTDKQEGSQTQHDSNVLEYEARKPSFSTPSSL